MLLWRVMVFDAVLYAGRRRGVLVLLGPRSGLLDYSLKYTGASPVLAQMSSQRSHRHRRRPQAGFRGRSLARSMLLVLALPPPPPSPPLVA